MTTARQHLFDAIAWGIFALVTSVSRHTQFRRHGQGGYAWAWPSVICCRRSMLGLPRFSVRSRSCVGVCSVKRNCVRVTGWFKPKEVGDGRRRIRSRITGSGA
jgi:hypothetical protein